MFVLVVIVVLVASSDLVILRRCCSRRRKPSSFVVSSSSGKRNELLDATKCFLLLLLLKLLLLVDNDRLRDLIEETGKTVVVVVEHPRMVLVSFFICVSLFLSLSSARSVLFALRVQLHKKPEERKTDENPKRQKLKSGLF